MSSFAGNRFSVRSSELHGLGVYALETIEVDEDSDRRSVFFEEAPNLFLQSLENRSDNLVCGHCRCFVGTMSTHFDVLMRKVGRQDQEELVSRSRELSNRGDFQDSTLSDIVLCEQRCGEMYCSESCAKQHWHSSHCLLCTGALEEEAPLVKFKVHAMENNEIFLMAGDHFANVCSEVDRTLAHVVDLNEKAALAESVARVVVAPYSDFVRQLWWDVAIAPDGTDPVTLKDSLIMMVDESWSLLNEALGLEARGLGRFLSPEYLSRTIGMFEQNNVGVRLLSPLAASVSDLEPGEAQVAYYSCAAQLIAETLPEDGCEEEEEEEEGGGKGYYCGGVDALGAGGGSNGEMEVLRNGDDDDDDDEEEESGDPAYDTLFKTLGQHGDSNIFPPLDGSAFYLNICRINHSCEPNVRVEYVDKGASSAGGGLTAQVRVLRPIAVGEELVQAYVDEDAPYEERVLALRDYGFVCACAKCVRME